MKMLSLATIFKNRRKVVCIRVPRVQDVEGIALFVRPAFWPEPAADTPAMIIST